MVTSLPWTLTSLIWSIDASERPDSGSGCLEIASRTESAERDMEDNRIGVEIADVADTGPLNGRPIASRPILQGPAEDDNGAKNQPGFESIALG